MQRNILLVFVAILKEAYSYKYNFSLSVADINFFAVQNQINVSGTQSTGTDAK